MIGWTKDANGIFISSNAIALSYPEEGNAVCFSWEQNSPWFKQRNELILAMIKRHSINGDFLDIGGGNGFQAKAMIDSGFQHKVILCEPGAAGCLNAKKRGLPLVYCGLFQDMPLEEYDIKGCGLFDVVEHIEDDVLFLNELYDKVPTGTKVFINVPAMKMLWSQADEIAGHYRRYNKKEVERLKQQVKFRFAEYGYYFSFYFLPMLLLRVIPYRLGIRKSHEKVMEDENKNHSSGEGLFKN